jgi:hypothetical protein
MQAATDRWLAEGEHSGRLRLLFEEDRVQLYEITGD